MTAWKVCAAVGEFVCEFSSSLKVLFMKPIKFWKFWSKCFIYELHIYSKLWKQNPAKYKKKIIFNHTKKKWRVPSQIHNISIPASAPTVVMRCASGESPSRSLSQTFQRIDAFCDEVVCGREHGDLIRVSQSLKPSKKKSNTSEIHLKLKADFISLNLSDWNDYITRGKEKSSSD